MQVLGFSVCTLPKQAQDKKIPRSIVCTSFFVSGMSLLIAYGPPYKTCKILLREEALGSALLEKVRVPPNVTYSAVTTVSY